ncbi:SDR family NAD(P)-dependent oxidoreductase [Microbispora sp. NEAU-D428]|uniref:SDR family NAD(P)-dependent oxidoreductase n=1 Tax=Microbispora sitophila TaxID=2771537 RepID=UPI001868D583|nr:SDR family NAD(P)-dependent oxidoreductase [Microbispora sitophila]MBE3014677.1 SDR family NAD(P)-dependent oxidoreductase [Microbispora sitophila]
MTLLSEQLTGRLAGRRVIVVGGSTGIGRGIADAWAGAGAEVVVCSRRRPSDAPHLHWERIDLTEPDHARERLAELGAGQVDAACFSSVHYGTKRAAFGEVPEEEWQAQLDVNVTGLWRTLHALMPSLRKARPGLFLGVSSEVAFNAGPGRSGYAASKAAAKALLDSVAQEIAQEKDQEKDREDEVRIVQVLPAGMVDTPGIRRRRPEGFDYSSYMKPSSFGRLAVELAATAGDGHHGDSLVVDGDGTWRSAYEAAPVSQSRTPA